MWKEVIWLDKINTKRPGLHEKSYEREKLIQHISLNMPSLLRYMVEGAGDRKAGQSWWEMDGDNPWGLCSLWEAKDSVLEWKFNFQTEHML